MTRLLSGRVILIAGAGSGIGRAAAIRLALDGVRLALVGRTAQKLIQTAHSLAAGSDAECYALDIGDPAAVDDLARAVVARFGAIDAVVNTAGRAGLDLTTVMAMTVLRRRPPTPYALDPKP